MLWIISFEGYQNQYSPNFLIFLTIPNWGLEGEII